MKYSVVPSSTFKRQVKRLLKKYPTLKTELLELEGELQRNPTLGTPLGTNCYKIRVAIRSKGKGKSGGARIITYTVTEEMEVYLLTIYDKSEISSVSDQVISALIDELKQ